MKNHNDALILKTVMKDAETVIMTTVSNDGEIATFNVTLEGSDEVVDTVEIYREEETQAQFLANFPIGHVNKGMRKASNEQEFLSLQATAKNVRLAGKRLAIIAHT